MHGATPPLWRAFPGGKSGFSHPRRGFAAASGPLWAGSVLLGVLLGLDLHLSRGLGLGWDNRALESRCS